MEHSGLSLPYQPIISETPYKVNVKSDTVFVVKYVTIIGKLVEIGRLFV